jgi:hypothetical protein
MSRPTPLDKQWDDLMLLCRKEAEFQQAKSHPRLTQLVSVEIDRLARDMGFEERQIVEREFRAERDAGHIVRLLTSRYGSPSDGSPGDAE